MSLEIRTAVSPDELAELFRLRYKVFVEEKGYYPENPERRIYDPYDFLPGTRNFIAFDDGTMIGSIRATEAAGPATAVDSYFDFRPHLPLADVLLPGRKVITAGMFFVLSRYRRMGRTALAILTLLSDYAVSSGKTHIIAAVAPDAEGIAAHKGFQYVAPPFFHEGKQLWVAPMILELSPSLAEAPAQASPRRRAAANKHWAVYSQVASLTEA
ncbi:MAG: hypothetical protein MJE77_14635 [Proteobacteria bacterium]|nr:hypothetical protein [Pseudomonadota bacterium]